jgi:predicted RNA-binding protein with PUA-like domain
MSYWIVKSDPENYSWQQMKIDKKTIWDGVRNYTARNNLKLMKVGDILLFYLSNEDKAIFGEIVVTKEYFQDPTTEDEAWVAVGVKYKRDLKNKVSLSVFKSNNILKETALVKNSRLSVIPLTVEQYNEVIKLSNS